MMYSVAIIGFAVAGLCGTIRLLYGPSLGDRIIALDVTLMSLMGAVTVHAAENSDTSNLILVVVLAIVGFTATVAASRFLEHEALPVEES